MHQSVKVLVSYHLILPFHSGQLVLVTSLGNISPPCPDEKHVVLNTCNISACTHAWDCTDRTGDKHNNMSIHPQRHVVSLVRGDNPESLNIQWAMSNHMEVFFLVKPAGLFHDSSPGTTFYCTQMRLVLNSDLLLRKHAATTSPPARQNCRLKAMTQKLSDNEWTSSCHNAHKHHLWAKIKVIVIAIPLCSMALSLRPGTK